MIYWKFKLIAIIFLLILICVITHFVKKEKISVKYAITWYLSCLVMIIVTVFTPILTWFTNLIGIEVSSNLLFVILIAFLFFMDVSLTIYVSELKKDVRNLTQEISILKGREANENK